MKKFIATKDLYFGQLVVVTTHAEAQVRTIAEIHKRETGAVFAVTFLWKEGNRMCRQAYEPWTLHKPTIEQIEYSITANGALVSAREVAEYLNEQRLQEQQLAGENFGA